MIIDILSDLHLDFYFDPTFKEINKDAVKSIFDPIFLDNKKRKHGDVLVIAGDIGHYNFQNIQVLKIFKQQYYKNIVCVLGNHDYYLLNRSEKYDYDSNSFNRVKQMREMINSEDNIYCLDGNIIEIGGVKFGGCDGWYDDSYMSYYFPKKDNKFINGLWKVASNDSEYLYGVENFDDIFKIEKKKIQNVYKECDVMITHINPSYLDEHINEQYRGNDSNTFFSFNGHDFLNNGNMKYWIFGHTHDNLEYEFGGVKCVCNPMGYPSESNYGDWVLIKSIEI